MQRIFLHDTRIATNVKVNSERAISIKADGQVAQQVLGGKPYIGVADVVKVPHLTIYTPIKDASGNIVGQSKKLITPVRNIILAIIAVVGILTIAMSLFVVRKIVELIKVTRHQLADIAQGEGDFAPR